jgi:hypothetical protein
MPKGVLVHGTETCLVSGHFLPCSRDCKARNGLKQASFEAIFCLEVATAGQKMA